jgi:hypothetical protein
MKNYAFALAVTLMALPAFAQSPVTRNSGSPQVMVPTAPHPGHPATTVPDQGAGVPGAAAFPAAPHGPDHRNDGPPSPQAGVPGIQDPSQQN